MVKNGRMKEDEETFEAKDYSKMSISELKDIAKDKGIKGYSKMSKDELVSAIKDED